MRYWFRGELLPLPADLLLELKVIKNELLMTQIKLDATQNKLEVKELELTNTLNALHSEKQARASLETELARMREELSRTKPQT